MQLENVRAERSATPQVLEACLLSIRVPTLATRCLYYKGDPYLYRSK